MTVAQARVPLAWVDWQVGFLLLGYLAMRRSFAHWGVAPVYVGEVALASCLLLCPRSIVRPLTHAVLAPGRLSGIAWCLLALLGYGLLSGLRGLANVDQPIVAAQQMVFNVYPLFFFVGLWVGTRHPQYLPAAFRAIAWVNGLYGVVYLTLLSSLGLVGSVEQATQVPWFGQPSGSAVALLGLLSFEPRLRRVWLPLLLNGFVLLGVQVRAEWLGLLVALPAWGYLSGRLLHLTKIVLVVASLLVVGLLTDFAMPSPATRGGQISTRDLAGRAVAAVAPRVARELTDQADSYGSTVTWRFEWWGAIWDMVHASPGRALFGPGYGYDLWALHPTEADTTPLRTPHSAFMYALGYTGWTGAVLFYALQLSILWVLWGAYRLTRQPFGVCYWSMCMAWAAFDNFFEAPFGAIPFYLLVGLAAAPVLAARRGPRASRRAPGSATPGHLALAPRRPLLSGSPG